MRRQELGERLLQCGAGLGHVEADILGPVGGQDARPARVGHDGNMTALGGWRVEEAFAEIEQLFDCVDADSATLPQGSVVDSVRTGHGAGV